MHELKGPRKQEQNGEMMLGFLRLMYMYNWISGWEYDHEFFAAFQKWTFQPQFLEKKLPYQLVLHQQQLKNLPTLMVSKPKQKVT